MKHFSMQKWVDFVRGAVAHEQSRAMQKHLDSGCSNCRKLVESWKQVLDCAVREKSYGPPDASIRMVKAQFALSHPHEGRARKVDYAELVFNSFAQPAPAGIRSGGTRPWQLMFRRSNYSIDVRIESRDDGIAIIGQVLDSGQAGSGVCDIPVRLMTYKQQTTTNRFGEFQFEVESMEDPGLLFVMSEERDLIISIPVSQVPSFQSPGTTVVDATRNV